MTLFHAGRISTLRPPAANLPVSVTGWGSVAPEFAATARRYVEQVTVSLRPNTVRHIEHDLRQFGTWLARTYPAVASCADLQRTHWQWTAKVNGKTVTRRLNQTDAKLYQEWISNRPENTQNNHQNAAGRRQSQRTDPHHSQQGQGLIAS